MNEDGAGRVVAFIPARMGASRFPGKPLEPILGLPLVEHVRRRSALAETVDEVIVATCDTEIQGVVEGHGGRVIMTASTHERCTDRIAEAALGVECEIALIVQGDEPLFEPRLLDSIVAALRNDDELVCANLLSVIESDEERRHQDNVKAVLDERGRLLYLSRAPIPFVRNDAGHRCYRQTGLSGFRRDFLFTFEQLAPTILEEVESVDFLRILGHGFPIAGIPFEGQLIGVDRPEDVVRVEQVLQNDRQQAAHFSAIQELAGQ
jgi:3-deoxy-manno-octulosonate cytidylyltransferase (CMP-KDO synthetase)